MPGRILRMADFSYPASMQASLTKFPVDAFNMGLAAIATDLGLTHLFDPAYLADGVAPDLETTGKLVATAVTTPTGGDASFTISTTAGSATINVTAVGAGNLVVGQPVAAAGLPAGTYISALGTGAGGTGTYTVSANATATATGVAMTAPAMAQFAIANSSGILADFAKTETSFSALVVINQTAADMAVAGSKVALGTINASFFLVTAANVLTVGFNGTNSTFSLAAGTHVLLISYDDASKIWQLRGAADNLIGTGTLTATPANGSPWRVGNLDTGRPFQGRIGNAIIFNKALHLPGNAALRAQLLALARAKYGL
ncbi:hypothetical protein [Novosphingobium gossypii]|uniref:hypothetical protein n=1 Tax=Novosphingobium gossypii TaxID=1604774 RepID=UPI003D202D18